MLGRHQRAGRYAAQVRDEEIVAAFQLLGGVRIDRDTKQWCAVVTAEKHQLLLRRNGFGCRQCESWIAIRLALAPQHALAAGDEDKGPPIGLEHFASCRV